MAQGQLGEAVALRRVPLAALGAAVIAAVANGALFLVGRAVGAIGAEVALPNGQLLGIGAVVGVTVVTAIGAAVVYAIMGVFGQLIRRPITIFRVLAALLLLGSLASPFGIVGAGAGLVVFLILMHTVAAVTEVWCLTTLARQQ